MSVVLKDTSKIDRLSQLPPELLQDVFNFAATVSLDKLCADPISKSLLPFHEKALYRFLEFATFAQFDKFAKTLDSHPSRASHPRQIVWKASLTGADLAIFQRTLSSLPSVIRLELPRYTDGRDHSTLFTSLPNAFKTLRDCTLCEIDLTTEMMQWLQQRTSLVQIEFFDVFIDSDPTYPTIPQVKSLALGSYRFADLQSYPLLFALPGFFPSAAITKLDLSCSDPLRFSYIRALLTSMDPTLRTLRLHSPQSYESRTQPIDDLLPRFPLLQKLQLANAFTSYDTYKYLLSLPHLIDLRIAFDYVDTDLRRLFQGPERLPHLRTLGIDFVPVPYDEDFNFEYALKETKEHRCDKQGDGLMIIKNCRSFTKMFGWALTFGDLEEYEEGMELADEITRVAKESGIHVWNNLHWIRCYFRRKIVEYYNRGIGRLYFYNDTSVLEDARNLAEIHSITLPELEIDPEVELIKGKIECFKVRMKGIEDDGIDYCYGLNLRYKKDSGVELS